VSHALAAMAPCMRLYAWLGQQLLPDLDPASPYADWVRTYADPEFEALAATLEDMIDRLGGDPGRMAEHYATAMRLERDFFASAHEIGTAR
ncbi:MAG: TenA family protein, partial [Actinomycetota bacterium]